MPLDLEESNDHLDLGTYADPLCGAVCDLVLDNSVRSDYDATNVAVFGEVRFDVAERAELTAGLRAERRSASFADSAANRFDPDDDMLGGELALTWRLDGGRSTYVRLARGYKAGGFNVALAGVDFGTIDNGNLTPAQIEFDQFVQPRAPSQQLRRPPLLDGPGDTRVGHRTPQRRERG